MKVDLGHPVAALFANRSANPGPHVRPSPRFQIAEQLDNGSKAVL
jgi:hypothetical protein